MKTQEAIKEAEPDVPDGSQENESGPRYQPLLICAGKCMTGPNGLGTRHRYVGRSIARNYRDESGVPHQIYACTVCKEQRRWG